MLSAWCFVLRLHVTIWIHYSEVDLSSSYYQMITNSYRSHKIFIKFYYSSCVVWCIQQRVSSIGYAMHNVRSFSHLNEIYNEAYM